MNYCWILALIAFICCDYPIDSFSCAPLGSFSSCVVKGKGRIYLNSILLHYKASLATSNLCSKMYYRWSNFRIPRRDFEHNIRDYTWDITATRWSARHEAHVEFQKRCGGRTYNLKGGPQLVKKRNAFIHFYQIRIKALRSYRLTKKCSAYFCGRRI